MSYEFIEVEKKDHVTIITMNRPKVMNCISPLVSQEMSKVINEYDEDSNAWVCIITGAGEKAFSAGNDLRFTAEHGPERMRKEMEGVKGGFGGITSRFDCFKPFIAAVNGFALGGGFEIALACDVIIASEKASFGLPEHRVGLIPGAGGVHRLPRIMPYHIAMGMILASKRITAQEAYQYGVVSEVVPADKLMETAEAFAEEIMLGSPLALRASKEATIKGMGMTIQDAMATTFPGQIAMQGTEDIKEGPLAFSQKRKPEWKGR